MEEKKDWVEEIGNIELEISYTSGVYDLAFLMGYGWYEEVEKIVEQIKQESREEGRKAERDRIFRGLDSIDCIKEALPKNYSASGMQFGIYRAKEIVLEKELSKLTTK